MVQSNYIGCAADTQLTDKEWDSYVGYMMSTFMCPLCEVPHDAINGKRHSLCQMPNVDDSDDYPDDWEEGYHGI